MSSATIRTKHYENIIDQETATALYYHLESNIEWEDGIPSRSGFTRKAKPIMIGCDPILDKIIFNTLSLMQIDRVTIHGIYLNYYRDGKDYAPNHSHKGMKQVVMSLGATRKLSISKKFFEMKNGDAIIFGSSIHGIPKDPNCKEGRISIALFLQK